ncbi:uncharacterized protein K460DRAFT_392341 [Cucurbitaria berberidis CBS 394.84]|uniref:DUF3533 domain-containing protein n=1 Tax=Cucurbitaria berberidis CBS 394.84 TaxID=1168544 RepID=A0A9P4GVQ1_9PLEO|nr:uncharacterized protein K460DRAFT_392341 [Cucurbitaria berberidis CBS 394.84]KAF1852235.1 hypothetical protein K460DRAFT_392341 [Cucurbitaria berberidis CBS 394.84]
MSRRDNPLAGVGIFRTPHWHPLPIRFLALDDQRSIPSLSPASPTRPGFEATYYSNNVASFLLPIIGAMAKDLLEQSASQPSLPERPPSPPQPIPAKNEEGDRLQAVSVEATQSTTTSLDYPKFWIATVLAGLAVICVFAANLSYLYGSLYQQTARSQALHILMVDFDNNGSVAQAMVAGYQHLISPAFPTFILRDAAEFKSLDDLVGLVREEKYWAAIYVTSGASQRLSAAIAGNLSDYNPNTALVYVWNQIRYPATTGAVVMPSLLQLISATQTTYHKANAKHDLGVLSTVASGQASASAVQAFLNPVGATPINIRPAAQVTKNLYNTVSLAVPIVQTFFFIVAFNGICESFALYTRSSAKVSGTIRFLVGGIYSCFAALGTTGYIWAFREDWAIPGQVFVETWMLLWFMKHIYYLIWDCATAFLPMPAMPFIIVTFLFLSITSANSPFEVTPGFYRWSQSLPAFETLQMLWNVWSGSSVHVYQAIPILFAWWLVWMVLATLGFIRRRRLASKDISLAVH